MVPPIYGRTTEQYLADLLGQPGTTEENLARLLAEPLPARGIYGEYMKASFTLKPDTYLLQYLRLQLNSTTQAVLMGNAQIILFSFRVQSRLVLAGRG